MADKSERERLSALIDEAYDGLEGETELDRCSTHVTYLRSLLELRERFYNESAEETKKREEELLLERLETERRQRELMEEQHKIMKRQANVKMGTDIAGVAVNAGLGVTDKIMHASDVNKALTVEAGGHLTTPFAKSWEQSLARNR